MCGFLAQNTNISTSHCTQFQMTPILDENGSRINVPASLTLPPPSGGGTYGSIDTWSVDSDDDSPRGAPYSRDEFPEPVQRCCHCCSKVAIPPSVFGPVCWVVSLIVVTSTPCFMYIFILLWALVFATLPLKLVRQFGSQLLTFLVTYTFMCVVAAYIVNIPFQPLPMASSNKTLLDAEFLGLQFFRLIPFTPPGLGVTSLTSVFFFFMLCRSIGGDLDVSADV